MKLQHLLLGCLSLFMPAMALSEDMRGCESLPPMSAPVENLAIIEGLLSYDPGSALDRLSDSPVFGDIVHLPPAATNTAEFSLQGDVSYLIFSDGILLQADKVLDHRPVGSVPVELSYELWRLCADGGYPIATFKLPALSGAMGWEGFVGEAPLDPGALRNGDRVVAILRDSDAPSAAMISVFEAPLADLLVKSPPADAELHSTPSVPERTGLAKSTELKSIPFADLHPNAAESALLNDGLGTRQAGEKGTNLNCALCLEGSQSFQTNSTQTQVTLTSQYIRNYRSSGTTNPLYLELWAVPTDNFGGSVNHYTLASYYLGQLQAGFQYTDVSATVPFSAAPNGCYYIAIMLVEKPGGYSDWWIFDDCIYWTSQSGACCGPTSCTYNISSTSNSFGSGSGSGSFGVTATSGCTWTAAANSSWISITGGSSGTGNGTVSYSVASNTTTSSRTGTITAAGRTFTITQSGQSCSYSISPTSNSFGSGSGSGSFSVNTSSGCGWTASSNTSWITITGGSSGSGNGTVSYSVSSNSSSSSRTGTITAAGRTFTISQSGLSCTYSLSPTSNSFASGSGSGSFSVNVNSGCTWTASANNSWISITGGSSGSGNGTVSYSVTANTSTSSSRTGTISAGGQTFTITQNRLVSDDGYEPNNNLASVYKAVTAINPTTGGNTISNLVALNEDWYRISLGVGRSARIRANFTHSQGNLQMQLYNGHVLDSSGWPVRIGESYTTSNTEEIAFVDRYGLGEIYVRFYVEGNAYSGQSYSFTVFDLGADDQYEPNNGMSTVMNLSLDSTYSNLICRDDDYFRINTSGVSRVRVRLEHTVLSGQLYYEVMGRDGGGNYGGLTSAGFVPNENVMEADIELYGRDHIIVRVYGATRGSGVYNLRVSRY